MKLFKTLAPLFLLGIAFFLFHPTDVYSDEIRLNIGQFSKGDISGWEQQKFEGETSYLLTQDNGKTVIKAESQHTSSGFVKTVKIDLHKTPYLNWSWKIENTLDVKDEKTKQGDDYPARIYIVVKTGRLPWSLNAISYVWSSVTPVETIWPSAYSEKAWLIAVESGDELVGQWQSAKRNILKDYLQCFKKEIRYIDAVAIMTDTDNSKSKAVAYYGDIFFTAE